MLSRAHGGVTVLSRAGGGVTVLSRAHGGVTVLSRAHGGVTVLSRAGGGRHCGENGDLLTARCRPDWQASCSGTLFPTSYSGSSAQHTPHSIPTSTPRVL